MFRVIEDIVETLENAKNRGKKCSVLIGAGCSVTADIPTAQGFVDLIQQKYPRDYERAGLKTYAKCMAQLAIDEQRSLIIDAVDKAKVNWAHLALAQLMKAGYVDRVLTTNFDPLVMRACALVGLYPATYDLAASQHFEPDKVPDQAIFHLHGQRTGFVLLNSDRVLEEHSKKLAPIFEDAGRGRVWLVVGYSGENDPVFTHLANVDRFDNKLYWIGYKENEPGSHVQEHLLKEDKYAFYIKGFDADSFFVTLAQMLGCFPPDFVSKPFSHLESLFDSLTSYTFPKINAPVNAMLYARNFVQEAIEKIEVVQSDVLQAWSNLLGGQHDKVIELRSKYAGTMHPEVQEAVSWAYLMQGNDFFNQAKTNSGLDSVEFYRIAIEKYAEAVKTKSNRHEAYYNWGIALSNWSVEQGGAEAAELFRLSEEKFAESLKIKPNNRDAIFSWGIALHSRAKMMSGPEADALFEQAGEKYEQATKVKPNDFEALDRWGQILMSRYELAHHEKKQQFFNLAKEKLLKAEAVKTGSGSYNLACLYALANELDESEKWLVLCKTTGSLPNRKHLEEDPDLKVIRDQQWFKELIKDLP